MTTTPHSGPTLWKVNRYSWRAAEQLSASLDIPLVTAMVLCGRGITDASEARMFLDCAFPLPDPFLFSGMEGAVRTLSAAVDSQRRIIIHGDYDADGITATALLLLGLRGLGADPQWYLPSRFQEGFGLSRQAVETIAREGDGVLVTVDCGVNYPEEVALARSLGLDVVVVDHHQAGPVLPDCHLVHPDAGAYPHDHLCGVGLALKVMHGLHVARLGATATALPSSLEGLLDLVAIGTIADLASLRGENRYYVREGLKLIQIGHRLGIRALAAVSGCTGAVDSGTVAYRLAPRLNAAGRLADPSPPLRLLLTQDQSEADVLAARLHELNGARQDVERGIFEEAVKLVDDLAELPPVIVLAGEGWHEGVVGIVASRLVERYVRPAILLGVRDGVAKGSGRSIPAYDLLSGLTACDAQLTVYGGHTQAVGLTLDARHVQAFRSALEEHAGGFLADQDLLPAYRADAVLSGQDLNPDIALSLASLGPFGSDNPRPRVMVVDAALRDAGATRSGAHLRCTVEVDGVRVRGIGFDLGSYAATALASPEGYIIGANLRVDEWKGTMRPELVLDRIEGPQTGVIADLAPVRRFSFAPEATSGVEGAEPGEAAGPAGSARMPAAHDRRGCPGRLSALAQVLATGEPGLLLTCNLPRTHEWLQRHRVLRALTGGDLSYAGWGSGMAETGRTDESPSALAEWDRLALALHRPGGWSHAVALDPPYRAAHVRTLRRLSDEGAVVHLLYGTDEREAAVSLLRYTVHPRFAMVCLYKATREAAGPGAEDRDPAGRFGRAAEIAWREARVLLTSAAFLRAAAILEELGVERHDPGEGKLDAGSVPAYAEAVAEYEECVRLCRSL